MSQVKVVMHSGARRILLLNSTTGKPNTWTNYRVPINDGQHWLGGDYFVVSTSLSVDMCVLLVHE